MVGFYWTGKKQAALSFIFPSFISAAEQRNRRDRETDERSKWILVPWGISALQRIDRQIVLQTAAANAVAAFGNV